MFKHISKIFFISLIFIFNLNSYAVAQLPTEKELQVQIESAKKLDQADTNNKALVQTLEETLSFLIQIEKQKADIEALNKAILDSQNTLKNSQANLEKLKNVTVTSIEELTKNIYH